MGRGALDRVSFPSKKSNLDKIGGDFETLEFNAVIRRVLYEDKLKLLALSKLGNCKNI